VPFFSFSSLLFFFSFYIYLFSYNFPFDRSASMHAPVRSSHFSLSTYSDNTYLCNILFFMHGRMFEVFFFSIYMHGAFCLYVHAWCSASTHLSFPFFYSFSSYFHFSFLMELFNDNFFSAWKLYLSFHLISNYLFLQFFYFIYIVIVLYIYNLIIHIYSFIHSWVISIH